MQNIKCVVVGNASVGKTSLLNVYMSRGLPDEHSPTVFDTFTKYVTLDDRNINLSLWDTAGQERFNKLRPLSYKNADILLLCFSLVDKISLVNIGDIWYPEVKSHCPDSILYLVGTKKDLVNSASSDSVVSDEEKIQLRNDLNLTNYFEISSKTNDNLNELFNDCIRKVINRLPDKPKKKSKCNII